MKKWIAIGVLLLVTALFVFGREVTSSQQTTPTFAGVSQEKLERQGIHLSLAEHARVPDTIPESRARDVATQQFGAGGGLRIKDSVLAILRDDQPRPGYNGPVWVFAVDPTQAPGGGGGSILTQEDDVRATDAMLLFVNARTGEFLFASEFGHIVKQ